MTSFDPPSWIFWISLFLKKGRRNNGKLSWNAYEMYKIHEFLNFDQEDWKKNYRFISNRWSFVGRPTWVFDGCHTIDISKFAQRINLNSNTLYIRTPVVMFPDKHFFTRFETYKYSLCLLFSNIGTIYINCLSLNTGLKHTTRKKKNICTYLFNVLLSIRFAGPVYIIV